MEKSSHMTASSATQSQLQRYSATLSVGLWLGLPNMRKRPTCRGLSPTNRTREGGVQSCDIPLQRLFSSAALNSPVSELLPCEGLAITDRTYRESDLTSFRGLFLMNCLGSLGFDPLQRRNSGCTPFEYDCLQLTPLFFGFVQ